MRSKKSEPTPPRATPLPSGFLQGGGGMGARMRDLDWAQTKLGPPETWPQSLRSTAGICLGSAFPIAIYWGPDLVLLYNDAWSPILGDKHPWALGRPAHEVWPEIWKEISPLFAQVLSTGEPVRPRDQLLPMRRRGFTEECYFDFTFSPIRDDHGVIGGVFNAVLETTQRVIGERRLWLLRDLAAESGDAHDEQEACASAARSIGKYPQDIPFALIYLFGQDGEGARLAAAAGVDAGSPIAPFDATYAPWSMDHAGISLVETLPAPPPAGPWPEPPARALVIPLKRAGQRDAVGFMVAGLSARLALDDEYRSTLLLVADAVAASLDRARAYTEERRRAEELAALDRAKTLFFSNVSHELRTPLTLLLGPVEDMLALEDSATVAACRDRLVIARRNALRLQKLVNTLLDFSRMEAGRTRMAFEPVDLSALTADLASTFRSAMEKGGLRFVVDCPPLKEQVWVDREAWEKIVLNLLSNAFKFTIEGQVTLSLREQDGRAVLQVRDSGVGIPADQLSRVFERFHRIEGQRGRSAEGTGIGLALVHDLVELHGGKIQVESIAEGLGKSNPGNQAMPAGTTFTVTLPFGRAHISEERLAPAPQALPSTSPAAHLITEAERWLPSQSASNGRGDGNGNGHDVASSPSPDRLDDADSSPAPQRPPVHSGRILLADDNADMRDYVSRLLTGAGYAVEAVSDGEAALHAARSRHPDLIVSDVMMPRLDGFGLLSALRADRHTAAIPIILLSARAGEEAHIDGLKAGANDYLVKPFSARELLARVAARLEIRRLHGQIAGQHAVVSKLYETIRPMDSPVEIIRAITRIAGEYFGAHCCSYAEVNAGGTHARVLADYTNGMPSTVGVHNLDDYGPLIDEMREGKPVIVTDTATDPRTATDRTRAAFAAISVRATFNIPLIKDGKLAAIFVMLGPTPHSWTESDTTLAKQIAELTFSAVAAARAGEALRQSEKALRASDKRKNEFLAMLAHELRNPLASINNAVALLKETATAEPGETADTRTWSVDVISRQSTQLARLVDDLLDVSRITRGRIELRRSRLDAAEVMSRAAETVAPLASAHGHELRANFPRGELWLDADPVRLEQIIVNLLTNAVKYTDQGGKIWLRALREGSEVVISVRDTGIGIPPARITEMFELFAQGDRSAARSEGGLGIGLTIVRQLAELHGGSVTAQSEGTPGSGSTFTVRLPAVTPPKGLSTGDDGNAAPVYKGTGARVLVVDDNADTANAVRRLLTRSGFTVELAHDGPTALEKAAVFFPSAVLLDIGLPFMDGYEVARRLRSEPGGTNLLIIAISGYGQEEDRARSRAAGIDHHMVKPVDIEKIRTLLASTLT